MLNNTARSAALPPGWRRLVGWLTSRRDATGWRPALSYIPLLLPEEKGD